MAVVSGCPACSSALGYEWPLGGRFPACTHCDRAWVPEDALEGLGWAGARLGPRAFTSSAACATCGGALVERTLAAADARLSTSFCETCRTITAPLSETVTFLKRVNGISAPLRPEREEPRAPPPERMRTISARDRLFAFLLMLPLELSADVRTQPPGVMTILLVCVTLFGATALTGGEATASLLLAADEPWASLVPHLLTCVFVHFNLFHLLGNLSFLYAFGRRLEERLGAVRFVATFLFFGMAGSLAYAVVHFGDERSLGGASGAIAGVMGCYLVLYPWRMVGFSALFTVVRIPAIFFLGLWFMFQLFSVPYQEKGIAYSAHAGGFLAGLVVGAGVRAGLPGLRTHE
jgi:membrane associated rhomboid family serine protease